MSQVTQDYIRKVPKAELHLHLEGCVTPSGLSRLSTKYGTELAGLGVEEVQAKYFTYSDFNEFLGTYKLVCQHLKSPKDYLQILRDLEDYFQEQGILYAELIYTPSIPWKFGRDGGEILDALTDSAAVIEAESGTKIRWILDCVRQFGREVAEKTAELAAEYQSKGVVAVGLGGDEKAIPLSDFEEVFNWVRAHELFVHIHAGEICGPEEVWDALRVLGANRIGHGIQSARDPKLMEYLKEHAIALDVCLTSNTKTRAWSLVSDHPFSLLFKRGVPVTLSTDDPGLFGTDLISEYKKAAEAFNLGFEQIHRLCLQGVRSSFLPHDERMELMNIFQSKIQRLT